MDNNNTSENKVNTQENYNSKGEEDECNVEEVAVIIIIYKRVNIMSNLKMITNSIQ